MTSTDINIKEAKIYVGTYAKYNNSSLEGDWLDLSDYSDKDEFIAACKELHKDECVCPECGSPIRFVHDIDTNTDSYECEDSDCGWKGDLEDANCEAEFMFQDWENIPEAFIDESSISEKFWELLEIMDDISDAEAFWVFLNHQLYDLDTTDASDLKSDFEEAYLGSYDSEEDYAESFMEECYEIPDHLTNYIDYEKFARDLFMDGYWYEDGYVFRDI